MPIKLLAWSLALALAALAAWHYRDANILQDLLRRLSLPATGLAFEAPSATAAPGDGALRKCLADGKVLYTDGACPAGSREQAVAGGAVSVLPVAPRAAGSAPGRVRHVRDLLIDADQPDLKERRIDAVIGQ